MTWILLPFVRKVGISLLKIITKKDSVVLLVACMDTQHMGISLHLILPSDHTTFTRSHSDESAPFAKLWFLKKDPLTFLPRSSNELITSKQLGSKAVYVETEIKIFHLWVSSIRNKVPLEHVLLKPRDLSICTYSFTNCTNI